MHLIPKYTFIIILLFAQNPTNGKCPKNWGGIGEIGDDCLSVLKQNYIDSELIWFPCTCTLCTCAFISVFT